MRDDPYGRAGFAASRVVDPAQAPGARSGAPDRDCVPPFAGGREDRLARSSAWRPFDPRRHRPKRLEVDGKAVNARPTIAGPSVKWRPRWKPRGRCWGSGHRRCYRARTSPKPRPVVAGPELPRPERIRTMTIFKTTIHAFRFDTATPEGREGWRAFRDAARPRTTRPRWSLSGT